MRSVRCSSGRRTILLRAALVMLPSSAALMMKCGAAMMQMQQQDGVPFDVSAAFIIYATAFAVLLVAYLTAISSRDLIRLLISLEMMFGAVFLSLIPMFSHAEMMNTAFSIAVLTIFVSSGELLLLIAAITIFDRQKRSIDADLVREGGDRV